jgi:hypothetical protein
MGGNAPFITGVDPLDEAAAMVARTDRGDCVFFHRGTHLCVVHRDLGETALPATCRHFPRLALNDRRGTFITLTHYCPTAASMLLRDDVPLEIVEAPAAFPPADYEGLNVTADPWPPMLHPRMLMDIDGYTAWERHAVRRCAAVDCDPESVVTTLLRDATLLRGWRPADGTLENAIAQLPRRVVKDVAPRTLNDSLRHYAEAITAVPDDLKPEPNEEGLEAAYVDRVRSSWRNFTAPLNRFLAAKAFASWTAYQGRGLLTIVRGLEAALALVRVEAARQCRDSARVLETDLLLGAFRGADFVLNHLAVGEDLAARWSIVESTLPAVPGS